MEFGGVSYPNPTTNPTKYLFSPTTPCLMFTLLHVGRETPPFAYRVVPNAPEGFARGPGPERWE